jgi:hypothetical protein
MTNSEPATIKLKFTSGGAPVAAPSGGSVSVASAVGGFITTPPPTSAQLTVALGSDNETATITPAPGTTYIGTFFLVYANAGTNPTSLQEEVQVVNGIDVAWDESTFAQG